jgi:hypothetical protein
VISKKEVLILSNSSIFLKHVEEEIKTQYFYSTLIPHQISYTYGNLNITIPLIKKFSKHMRKIIKTTKLDLFDEILIFVDYFCQQTENYYKTDIIDKLMDIIKDKIKCKIIIIHGLKNNYKQSI